MEKVFTCVGCPRNFKALSRPDKPVYRQHDVEMNVECPFCSRTNAIVWPQDESLPLVIPIGNRVSEQIRVQILDVAKELMGGRLGVEASRELSRFRHDIEPQLAGFALVASNANLAIVEQALGDKNIASTDIYAVPTDERTGRSVNAALAGLF
jgi:sRNA-binding carbon storage regulator CsrA